MQFEVVDNPRKNGEGGIHRESKKEINKSDLRENPIGCITIEGTRYLYTKCMLA